MTTPDLVTFIKNQLTNGAGHEQITKMLLGQGWTIMDITEGIAEATARPLQTPPVNRVSPPVISTVTASPVAAVASPSSISPTAAASPAAASPVDASPSNVSTAFPPSAAAFTTSKPVGMPTFSGNVGDQPIQRQRASVADNVSGRPTPVASTGANPWERQPVPTSFSPNTTGTMTQPRTFDKQPPVKRTGNGGTKWFVFITILILFTLGGLTTYAYFEQLGPFANPPYKSATLASDIFSGFGKIKTSSYSLHMNVVSQPKDADAVPFSLAVDDSAQTQAYKQDLDTVRDIQMVLQSLQTYYFSHKKYPGTLPQIAGMPASRLSLYAYSSSANSSDFSLTAQFQSTSAISEIQQIGKVYSSNASTTAVAVSGKSVTFTKSTPTYLYIPSEPPQPFLVSVLGMQQYLGYVPSDFSLDGALSGATAKTPDNKIDSQIHVSGSVNYSSISVSLDTQLKKVGDNIYVMLSKFPGVFGNLSKIENKWIMITPQDIATYSSGYLGQTAQSPQDQLASTKEKATQAMNIFLTVADKNQALVMSKAPTVETVNGVRAYRYDLEFNKATMPQFYTDLTNQFAATFKDQNPIAFDKATLDYLNSPQFGQAFDYFRNNTSLVLWADKNGTPLQIMYKLRMVPSASAKNSDQQVVLTMTLSLTDVNKEISIDAPADSMSLEDATIAMTGQSKEQYEFNKQESAVQTVRNLLSSFKNVVGTYPNSLDELTKSTVGLKGTYMPAASTLPQDIYTGKPFIYTKTASDYTLAYTIELPPYVKGTVPVSGIYTRSYDFSASNFNSMKEKIMMTAVNGQNTANSTTMSLEAASQSRIDSDGDGLPDVLENYLGTNPNKKDTDGDGYSDYDELIKGSDPLGPGNLTTGSGLY